MDIPLVAPCLPSRRRWAPEPGGLPPFVAVFPDGFTALGGSQWTNSPAIGRYQDYVADDVTAFVEARLGTVPSRGARAIVGKSWLAEDPVRFVPAAPPHGTHPYRRWMR